MTTHLASAGDEEHGIEEWLALVHAVVAAPVSATSHAMTGPGTPDDRVVELTAWTQQGTTLRAVARLVVALWLATDPMTGARRKALHDRAERCYKAIAQSSDRAASRLEAEAARHHAWARRWR
jgi:hypothetical protein